MKYAESKNVIVCREKNSPFWIAQFTAPDGTRKRRSTKVPVEGGLFQGERLARAQSNNRALLVAMSIAAEAEEVFAKNDHTTVRELCETMLAGKLGFVALATYANARTAYRQFCTYLGARAHAPARLVTRADMKAWVAATRRSVRAKTTRKHFSALRAAFAYAVDAEMIDRNPCDGVRIPPDAKEERILHEAFTLDEVRLLIDKLPEEWSAAVRVCTETYGQRLGDVLSLRWEQFDWAAGVVRMTTAKTGRMLVQSMRPDFSAWARARYEAAQERGGEAAKQVFPKLFHHSNPSQEFTALVRLHGIGLSGAGLGGRRRTWHSKTFHSLRATVATCLQASGVGQGLAMELVGHDSAAVHAAYIRPTVTTKRRRSSNGSSPRRGPVRTW